jgi:hypothetical protein
MNKTDLIEVTTLKRQDSGSIEFMVRLKNPDAWSAFHEEHPFFLLDYYQKERAEGHLESLPFEHEHGEYYIVNDVTEALMDALMTDASTTPLDPRQEIITCLRALDLFWS